MIAYRVRTLETDGAEAVEEACNSMARDGWRLVSTAAESVDALKTRVWLFFEREVTNDEIERAARQFASLATR